MRSRWRLPLLVLLASALAGSAYAETVAEKPLVALVRRSVPTGVEELSVTFLASEVRLVSNSNFMEPPGNTAGLGVFSAPLNPELKIERDVLRGDLAKLNNLVLAAKELGSPPAPRPESPHGTVWMLNGIRVEAGSLYRPNLTSLLARVRRLAAWREQDAVEVRLSQDQTRIELSYSGQKSRPSKSLAVREACTRRLGPKDVLIGYLCIIDGFGSAYLQPGAP